MVLAALSIRALGRAMIPSLIKRGVTARGYRRLLNRQFGMAYRDTILFADFREFRSMLRFEYAVRALKPETKPPKSIFSEATYKRERNYRGIGQAVYRNVDTGEMKDKLISMYDDHFESKQAFTDTWMRDKEWEESDPEWEFVSVEWYVIQHKEGRPY